MSRKPYPIVLSAEEVRGVLNNKEHQIIKAIRNPSTKEHKVRFDEAYSGYSIAGSRILWCMHRNIADSWEAAIAWDSWYSVYPPRGQGELLWVKEHDHMNYLDSPIKRALITSVYPEKIDNEWCWIINVRKVENE